MGGHLEARWFQALVGPNRVPTPAFGCELCAAPGSGDDLAHSGSWFYDSNGRLGEGLSQCRWLPDLNRGFGGDIGLFRDHIGSSFGNGYSNPDGRGKTTSRFTGWLPPARILRLFLSGHLGMPPED